MKIEKAKRVQSTKKDNRILAKSVRGTVKLKGTRTLCVVQD